MEDCYEVVLCEHQRSVARYQDDSQEVTPHTHSHATTLATYTSLHPCLLHIYKPAPVPPSLNMQPSSHASFAQVIRQGDVTESI